MLSDKQIKRYQQYCLFGGLIYFSWSLLIELLFVNSVEPAWIRNGIFGLALLVYLIPIFVPAMKDQFIYYAQGLFYLAGLGTLVLVHLNQFSIHFILPYFILLFFITTVLPNAAAVISFFVVTLMSHIAVSIFIFPFSAHSFLLISYSTVLFLYFYSQFRLRHQDQGLQQENESQFSQIINRTDAGILVLDPQLKISSIYSQKALAIFNQDKLSGQFFPKLLFPNQIEKQEEISFFLNQFFQGHVKPRMMQGLLLNHHVPYFVSGESHNGTCYLDLHYERLIGSKGQTSAILVTVLETTDRIELQKSLQQKAKELAEDSALITILCETSKEEFSQFIKQSILSMDEALNFIDEHFPPHIETIHRIMRVFNEFKAKVGPFKLFSLYQIAHELEETLLRSMEYAEILDTHQVENLKAKITYVKKDLARIHQKIIHPIEDAGEARGETRDLSILIPASRVDRLIAKADGSGDDGESESSRWKSLIRELEALKKVPCRKLFNRFPRMVESLAKKLGIKLFPLVIEGSEIEIDIQLMDRIGDALVHIIRNAVNHGIEPPEERIKKSKNDKGLIQLKVATEKNHLLITVEDDGRGLRYSELAREAVRKGLLSEEDYIRRNVSDHYQFIFDPKIASAAADEDLNKILGQGMGLSTVKTAIENLGGRLEIQSVEDEGTTIKMILPLNQTNGF